MLSRRMTAYEKAGLVNDFVTSTLATTMLGSSLEGSEIIWEGFEGVDMVYIIYPRFSVPLDEFNQIIGNRTLDFGGQIYTVSVERECCAVAAISVSSSESRQGFMVLVKKI